MINDNQKKIQNEPDIFKPSPRDLVKISRNKYETTSPMPTAMKHINMPLLTLNEEKLLRYVLKTWKVQKSQELIFNVDEFCSEMGIESKQAGSIKHNKLEKAFYTITNLPLVINNQETGDNFGFWAFKYRQTSADKNTVSITLTDEMMALMNHQTVSYNKNGDILLLIEENKGEYRKPLYAIANSRRTATIRMDDLFCAMRYLAGRKGNKPYEWYTEFTLADKDRIGFKDMYEGDNRRFFRLDVILPSIKEINTNPAYDYTVELEITSPKHRLATNYIAHCKIKIKQTMAELRPWLELYREYNIPLSSRDIELASIHKPLFLQSLSCMDSQSHGQKADNLETKKKLAEAIRNIRKLEP